MFELETIDIYEGIFKTWRFPLLGGLGEGGREGCSKFIQRLVAQGKFGW